VEFERRRAQGQCGFSSTQLQDVNQFFTWTIMAALDKLEKRFRFVFEFAAMGGHYNVS
jgi:hypothetical protein